MTIWLERLFLLLIFSLGFMQPSISVSGFAVIPAELIFLIVAGLFAVSLLVRPSSFEFNFSYVWLAAYFAAMALSAAFSLNPHISLIKLAGVTYLVGLAVIAFNLVKTEASLKLVVITWIVASTIVSMIGTITVAMFYADRQSWWNELFLHHYGSLPVGNYPRIQSTFIYPAMLCDYLTVGILLTLAAVKNNWISRKWSVPILVVHGIAAAFTLTPGLGGLIAGVTLWLAIYWQEGGRKQFSLIAVIVGSVSGLPFLLVSAFSIFPIKTSPYTLDLWGIRLDPTQRLLTWQGSIETFLANPIFGKGVGLGIADVIFQTPSGQMQRLTDAHQTFLSVAGQAGTVGVIALIGLIAYVVRIGLPLEFGDDKIKTVGTSLLIAFISGLVIQGLVGSFEDARHLWVVIGLIVATSRIK